MDKLDTLFQMQKGLDEFITKSRNLDYSREEWVQKRALALIVELGEVLEEAKYKWWKNAQPTDDAALKEELVDVLHFFLGMCIDAGLTADELFRIYLDKNQENYDRQTGKSAKSGYELK